MVPARRSSSSVRSPRHPVRSHRGMRVHSERRPVSSPVRCGDRSRANGRAESAIIKSRRVKGGLLSAMASEAEPFERARQLYGQACFSADNGALEAADRVLNGAEAALAIRAGADPARAVPSGSSGASRGAGAG